MKSPSFPWRELMFVAPTYGSNVMELKRCGKRRFARHFQVRFGLCARRRPILRLGCIPLSYWMLTISGWWCNNHLEKYESQWEGLSHILWKIKHVWNHQPDINSTPVYELGTPPNTVGSLSRWLLVAYATLVRIEDNRKLIYKRYVYMAVCQNLVPLVNTKIAGKWMFIPLKMVLIGIDPYPYVSFPYLSIVCRKVSPPCCTHWCPLFKSHLETVGVLSSPQTCWPHEPRQKPISFAMSLGYAYAGACALLTRTQCYLTRQQWEKTSLRGAYALGNLEKNDTSPQVLLTPPLVFTIKYVCSISVVRMKKS